jgi:hypothetical protein
MNRDSSAGIKRGDRLNGRADSQQEQDFSFLHSVKTGCGAHPASVQWMLEVLSLHAKRPGLQADPYLYLMPRSIMVGL